MAKRVNKRVVAAEAWRHLFDVLMSTAWRREAMLARLGLTPNDARALRTLDPTNGKRMRELADAWGIDAPYATWIVDRLERKKLARRSQAADDRRVRLVVLTARGAKLREDLLRLFQETPPELMLLSVAELSLLSGILGTLGAAMQKSVPPRARR